MSKMPPEKDIISHLKGLKAVQLSQKTELKSRLLLNIDQKPEPITELLASLRQQIVLAPQRKSLIKLVLQETVQLTPNPWEKLQSFLSIFRGQSIRFASVGMLIAILAVNVLGLNHSFNQTAFASEQRYLQNIDSSVSITRADGSVINFNQPQVETIRLEHNDILQFGANTQSEIKLLGSVIRPAPYSKIQIKLKDAQTNIELIEGSAWFNVNQVDKEITTTVSAPGITLVPHNAIFDLKSKEFTRIINIDTKMNGLLIGNKQEVPVTILPERTVKFRTNTPASNYEQLQFQELNLTDIEKERIRTNLHKDIAQADELIQEIITFNKEKAGATPDEPIKYAAKEAVRTAQLAFTIDESKRANIKTEIAQEKILEAKVLSQKSKNQDTTDQAESNEQIASLLAEAQDTIDQAAAVAKDLEIEKPIAAQQINQEIIAAVSESAQIESLDTDVRIANASLNILPLIEESQTTTLQTEAATATTESAIDNGNQPLVSETSETNDLPVPETEMESIDTAANNIIETPATDDSPTNLENEDNTEANADALPAETQSNISTQEAITDLQDEAESENEPSEPATTQVELSTSSESTLIVPQLPQPTTNNQTLKLPTSITQPEIEATQATDEIINKLETDGVTNLESISTENINEAEIEIRIESLSF